MQTSWSATHTKPQPGQTNSAGAFITPPSGTWGFVGSRVPFLRALLTKIQREGDGVEKTHMGKILSGVVSEEAGFSVHATISTLGRSRQALITLTVLLIVIAISTPHAITWIFS